MSCKTSLYSKINLLPNKKHKIMVIFTMLHISVLPASGPLSKPVELLDPAAMSKRGWITSILNTPFFCHRFSTLTILLWRRKRNIIKWAFDSNHLNHKMRVLNKELFKKKKKRTFGSKNILTRSSVGHKHKFSNVPAMFLVNLGPNTSFSAPNWCRDCLTMESTT